MLEVIMIGDKLDFLLNLPFFKDIRACPYRARQNSEVFRSCPSSICFGIIDIPQLARPGANGSL